MLERLDAVPWNSLRHAYGAASDVPEQLRKLLSPSEHIREDALSHLYGNIFHQGTRYQAALYAIPFLFEIIQSNQSQGKYQIIYFLISLALGYEEEYLPLGVNILDFRHALQDAESQMSPEARRQCDRFGYSPRFDLECYDSVRKGIPILIEALDDNNIKVKQAAVYSLAWFPEDAQHCLPHLYEALDTARQHSEIINTVLAIGLLSRSSESALDEQRIRRLLSSESLSVRVAAAIALAGEQLSPETLNTLIEGVLGLEDLRREDIEVHFNEGNLAGYASRVLAQGGKHSRTSIIPALCNALRKVKPYQSLDITSALLQLVVIGKDKPIREIPPNYLDPLDIMALRAIAQDGGWGIGDSIFVNYANLVGGYGLPNSRDALKNYLGYPDS